jgi:hypothetical protein
MRRAVAQARRVLQRTWPNIVLRSVAAECAIVSPTLIGLRPLHPEDWRRRLVALPRCHAPRFPTPAFDFA